MWVRTKLSAFKPIDVIAVSVYGEHPTEQKLTETKKFLNGLIRSLKEGK